MSKVAGLVHDSLKVGEELIWNIEPGITRWFYYWEQTVTISCRNIAQSYLTRPPKVLRVMEKCRVTSIFSRTGRSRYTGTGRVRCKPLDQSKHKCLLQVVTENNGYLLRDQICYDSMKISRRMGTFGDVEGRETLRSSQKHIESNELKSQSVEGEAITS